MPFRRRVIWTNDGFMALQGSVAGLWRACALMSLGTGLLFLAGVAARSASLLVGALSLLGLAAASWLALVTVRPRFLQCDLCGREAPVEARRAGIRQPPGWRIIARSHLNKLDVAFHEVYCNHCTPWARQVEERAHHDQSLRGRGHGGCSTKPSNSSSGP